MNKPVIYPLAYFLRSQRGVTSDDLRSDDQICWINVNYVVAISPLMPNISFDKNKAYKNERSHYAQVIVQGSNDFYISENSRTELLSFLGQQTNS